MFISMVDTTISSLYSDEKDGENIGTVVENKHINGLEINSECVIITFRHRCLVFNVFCGPRSVFASGINVDLGAATNFKHCKPVIESYIVSLILFYVALKTLLFCHSQLSVPFWMMLCVKHDVVWLQLQWQSRKVRVTDIHELNRLLCCFWILIMNFRG